VDHTSPGGRPIHQHATAATGTIITSMPGSEPLEFLSAPAAPHHPGREKSTKPIDAGATVWIWNG